MGDAASTIDVVYFNNYENIIKSTVLSFPFSKHSFVLSVLNFETNRSDATNHITTRVLNEKSLNLIRDELKLTDFSIINIFENVDERWHVIKRIIMSSLINSFLPLNHRKMLLIKIASNISMNHSLL